MSHQHPDIKIPTPEALLDATQPLSSAVPWHKVVSAIVELPEESQRDFSWHASRLSPEERQERGIAGIVHAVDRYNVMPYEGSKAMYRAVLKATDDTTDGYVAPRQVIQDVENRQGLSLKGDWLEAKASVVDGISQIPVQYNLLTRRGLLRARWRLINPENAIRYEAGGFVTPTGLRGQAPELQAAYQAFRLTAPNPDGSGKVAASEIAEAVSTNARDLVTGLGSPRSMVYSTPESASIRTAKDLAKLPQFESSGRFVPGQEQWIWLADAALQQTKKP